MGQFWPACDLDADQFTRYQVDFSRAIHSTRELLGLGKSRGVPQYKDYATFFRRYPVTLVS